MPKCFRNLVLLVANSNFLVLHKWSMRFEEEEVRAVALGTGWVAAITSCNFLRIFTEGGLQVYIYSDIACLGFVSWFHLDQHNFP